MKNSQPERTCLQCGVKFKRLTGDGKRAIGSVHMIHLDPNAYFHSMRCATLYGVRAAQQRHGGVGEGVRSFTVHCK
jgi:hypothetical protein